MTRDSRKALASSPLLLMSVALLWTSAAGCAQFNNPFRDPYAARGDYTTASVQGFRATPGARHSTRRFDTTVERPTEATAVTHGPLYFEDPCEEHGSDNGEFRWGADDYLFFATWRLRFLGNLVALPINMVITPPWRVMESDGELAPNWFGECHDATVSPCQCWCHGRQPCRSPSESPAASHSEESQAG